MKLTLHPYQLRFKFPFKIAHGVRETTDIVYVKLQHEGLTAWGEATLPPYLLETQKTVIDFLSKIDLDIVQFPLQPAKFFNYLDNLYPGNMSAKAALDMALWSLKAKIEDKEIGELLGIKNDKFPLCTYTIGVCGLDEMKLKVAEADKYGFQLYKIKLNGENDEEMIRNFKQLSDKPFAVDVNQGWGNLDEAIRKAAWLKDEGCILLEQPLPKEMLDEMVVLKREVSLPLYADESCQRLSDMDKLRYGFDGINIKLMKCGGISEAYQMIQRAKELDLKVLIGCMSESSVGCTAAAQLTPLAAYADLDGTYLISNDPFYGMLVQNGRIKLRKLAGISCW